MKQIYKLKPYNQEQEKEMRELDNQRRKKVEESIGFQFSDKAWQEYKQMAIKRRK